MSTKRALLRAATPVAAAAMMVGGGVAPASAADLWMDATPEKVVVNQSYENIRWQLRGPDLPWVDSVDAYLEHIPTREQSDLDFTFDGQTRGSFKFYDWERMGRYRVHGEAYDWDYNTMRYTPDEIMIKRGVRSPLTGKRSGKFVTLRTVTKRYDGGYPRWINHRNAKVRYQQQGLNGVWRTIATRTVPGNGVTQARVAKRSASNYRVVVVETAGAWSFTSPRVRR